MFFGVSGFGGRSRCGILLYDSGVHYTPNPGTIQPPIPQFSQSGLCKGSVQVSARPCLIKNSWIIQLNRGPEERLTISNPGVIRADPKTTFFYRLFRGEIVPDLAAGNVFHKHSD